MLELLFVNSVWGFEVVSCTPNPTPGSSKALNPKPYMCFRAIDCVFILGFSVFPHSNALMLGSIADWIGFRVYGFEFRDFGFEFPLSKRFRV